jgi:outer membrane protein OmpU
MKTITKGKNMNNFKKVGLTALAGSLAAISANAAEMSVSGASVLTYTSEDKTEVTGNPMGMKTNLGFTASGEVNGYTVSYMQTSADQFAGMSSARLSVDMGDLGVIAFDQGSGSGLATIDDKTPTAAEEIWDGIDAKAHGGLVGAAGSTGVFNFVNTYSGVKVNAAMRLGGGVANADGASSGENNSAMDVALTAGSDLLMVDGLDMGIGYGEAQIGDAAGTTQRDHNEHSTIFANYSYGPITVGAQLSNIDNGSISGVDQYAEAFGVAFNVNDNLSVSYGERDVEYKNNGAAHVTEKGSGMAIAYTMGSIKIAGNRNEVTDNQGTTGVGGTDSMTEIAVSFAF